LLPFGTVILHVVVYGCGNLSVILWEEYRLLAFDNLVLRKTFGPNKEEVTGDWRKLHCEELHDWYFSTLFV